MKNSKQQAEKASAKQKVTGAEYVPGDSGKNQPHNTQKEAMGPNTKR